MSNLALNLKFLRKKRSITQQQLADVLKVKRPVIGAYEEERAEPKLDTLQKMADFFEVKLEDLVSSPLSDGWLQERELQNDPSEKRIKASNRILSITVDSDNEENIELVPIKASAGYLNGYSDPEYISSLTRFRMPMFSGGTFRAFELKGDSMLPLTPGTFIIAEYLDNWHHIKNGDTYIVVSKQEGIVYKRIQNKLKEAKTLRLISDNQIYDAYTLHADDILEIWKARAFMSMQFPEPTKEASIGALTEMVSQLQQSMKELKKEKLN